MPQGEVRSRALLLLCFLAAFAALYLLVLGLRPLMTPDEGRYAEISREMLSSGDWVTPRLNGYRYFEKPPLQYWATALSFAVFGVDAWSARLWSALLYLAAGAAIGWCALRIYGREVASLAVLGYFGMALPFVLGQVDTLDSGVAGFLTIALCAFCVAQHERATSAGSARAPASERACTLPMLICWAAMGAAVLSKGLIGIVLPGATLLLYLVATRQWRLLARMQWVSGLALFALIVVPWFVLVSHRNPGFAQFFFVHEHLQRYFTTVHKRVEPWWYFLAVLALGLLPWTGRVLSALGDAVRERGQTLRVLLLLAIWSAFVTLFFSLSQSKLMPYVLPVFPALALILSARICAQPARGFRLTAALAAVLWAVLLVAAFVSAQPLQSRFDPSETLWILWWARIGSVAALALALIAWRTFARGRRGDARVLTAWRWLAIAQIVEVFFLTVAATPYGNSRSAVRYIAAAPEEFRAASDVYSVGELDQSLVFYLHREVTLVEFVNEFEYGMSVEPAKASLSLEAFRARWLASAHPVAVIENDRVRAVEALGLPAKIVYRDRRGAVMIPDLT